MTRRPDVEALRARAQELQPETTDEAPVGPGTRALLALERIRRDIDGLTRHQAEMVAQAREAGASWQTIGAVCGMTEKAARKRWETA